MVTAPSPPAGQGAPTVVPVTNASLGDTNGSAKNASSNPRRTFGSDNASMLYNCMDDELVEVALWNEMTRDVVDNVIKSKGAMDTKVKGAEEGKLVTRFAPEPSGYLHAGHIKALVISEHMARRFNGTFILRFDDTNTDKADDNFVESIIADMARMNVVPDRIDYTSDFFDGLQNYCDDLISKGLAYCDATPAAEMQQQRMERQESEYRNKPVEEHLAVWKEMKAGNSEYSSYVVRAKMNMKDNVGCMRDPVMYRWKDASHCRQGEKYKVYPTYDYSCPIVDVLEGITHPMRSLEYKDREQQYYWFCDNVGLERPVMWEFSRLEFKKTCLSKRNLRSLVISGQASGWDDPRFPTVQGLARRGMTMLALRAFNLSQGASRNNTMQSWDKIWTVNKRIIDPIVPRFVAVEKGTSKKVTIDGAVTEIKILPKHKKNPDLGTKAVLFSDKVLIEGEDAASFAIGEIVTFMDWGNMEVLERDEDGNLKVKFLPDDINFKKTKKITWLVDDTDLVPVEIVQYGDLLKRDLEKGENISEAFNDKGVRKTLLFGCHDLRLLKVGEKIQLERRGYYRCDEVLRRESASDVKPVVLIEIPDGKVSKEEAAEKKRLEEEKKAAKKATKQAAKEKKKAAKAKVKSQPQPQTEGGAPTSVPISAEPSL